ncbi:hypothetical protein OKW21_004648 [Catalinimonas alkaloidigena]|uniref:hypothetical protein n=1 Tax=Catalinimonas alkaloidigena TaxID=1075417 RepID=UPI002405DA7E|nr:hypothetical protein [Catalinimonas alkaloidigena]MDF9799385.1 hypothetical protein [Catalinimonas alkaloidigena]
MEVLLFKNPACDNPIRVAGSDKELSTKITGQMEKQNILTATKIGAYTTLIGSLCMLCGAALWGSSGADLDAALDTAELENYLTTAHEKSTLLIANLSVWICGVMLLGVGATMMLSISTKRLIIAKIAQYNYWIAIPIVVVSYVAWLAVVVRLAPNNSPSVAAIAEAVGWFATRADWIATILILGTGPLLISFAGKDDWVPKWLLIWSIICLFTGILNALAMYAGGLTTYGFLIIPVGMSWMIASSIVLFRRL